MKKILPRDTTVLAAFRREISLVEKKVVSKKIYSRSKEHRNLRMALA